MAESPSRDFEDLLALLAEREVRYLIVGGLAFVFHARPRFTKDLDLWLDPAAENLREANRALAAFGSPTLLSPGDPHEVVQIGVEPNRIDLLQDLDGASFESAWQARVEAPFGDVPASWIALDDLIAIKERIDEPRHQEDARVLREVKRLRESDGGTP